MNKFKSIELCFSSGYVAFPYQFTISIDCDGYATWRASGYVETQESSQNVHPSLLEDISEWSSDFIESEQNPECLDICDAPKWELRIIRDGQNNFHEVHYLRSEEKLPLWIELADVIVEAVQAEDKVRPRWKLLADEARQLSGDELNLLMRRLESFRNLKPR